MNASVKDTDTPGGAPQVTAPETSEGAEGATVVRLHQSYVHYAKPVVSRKISIEAVQAVSAIIDALIVFCAGLILTPANGLSSIMMAGGLAALFVCIRVMSGGYARSIVQKTA